MTSIAIHGGITFLGKDSSAANLDLEESALDPVDPNPGRIWYNTTEARIKYSEKAAIDGDPVVIRSLPNSVDIASLQSFVDANYRELSSQLNVKPDVQDLAMIIQATLSMKAEKTDVVTLQQKVDTKADASTVASLKQQAESTSGAVTTLSNEVKEKLSASSIVPLQSSVTETKSGLSLVQLALMTKAEKGTTVASYGITDAQPLNAILTSISKLTGKGILSRADTGATVARTIAGTSGKITVTNGDGSLDNPTITISDDPVLPGTGGAVLPSGMTAQRSATPAPGTLRYNSSVGEAEVFTVRGWVHAGNVVLQSYSGSISPTSGTSQIVVGTSIPSASGGSQVFSYNFMPRSPSSRVNIAFNAFVDSSVSGRFVTATLLRDGVVVAVGQAYVQTAGGVQSIGINFTDSAPPDNGCVYSIRVGISGSGTWYLNRGSSNSMGSSLPAGVSIQESL